MNDSQIVNELRESWRGELRFLPFSLAFALGVALAVWMWRLDLVEQAFWPGVLVGSLLAVFLSNAMYVVNLGAALRGAPRRLSLLAKARWLVHGPGTNSSASR